MMITPRLLPFRLAASVLIVSVGFLAGCSGSPRVEGTVTFDGQPVEDGTINFFQEGDSGKRTNAPGEIKDGKYLINFSDNLGPGSYRVEIYWYKGKALAIKNDPDLTREPNPGQKSNRQQVIPKQYNLESKLTAEVKSGVNTFDFDLKSK
jgi:hypothetical protein